MTILHSDYTNVTWKYCSSWQRRYLCLLRFGPEESISLMTLAKGPAHSTRPLKHRKMDSDSSENMPSCTSNLPIASLSSQMEPTSPDQTAKVLVRKATGELVPGSLQRCRTFWHPVLWTLQVLLPLTFLGSHFLSWQASFHLSESSQHISWYPLDRAGVTTERDTLDQVYWPWLLEEGMGRAISSLPEVPATARPS